MKKLLSAALAAVMALTMGVSAFAVTWGNGEGKEDTSYDMSKVTFSELTWENSVTGDNGTIKASETATHTFNPGDVIYLRIQYNKQDVKSVPSNWTLFTKANDNVKSAEFVTEKGVSYVKLALVKDYNELDEADLNVTVYIHDTKKPGEDGDSQAAVIKLNFDNREAEIVNFDKPNNATLAYKWHVDADTEGTALFYFTADMKTIFTVPMNDAQDDFILNFSSAYDKAIEKYNPENGKLSFFNFKGDKDVFMYDGELFLPADKDTYVYEIVNGKPVAVDAKYVEDYTAPEGNINGADGWVINVKAGKQLGYYVVSTEKLNASASTDDKTNPGTGANDFVGVATALAVVSVVAAGAVAMKKR